MHRSKVADDKCGHLRKHRSKVANECGHLRKHRSKVADDKCGHLRKHRSKVADEWNTEKYDGWQNPPHISARLRGTKAGKS